MTIIRNLGTPAGVTGTAPSLESGDQNVQRGEMSAQGDNAGRGDPGVTIISLGTQEVSLETGRPKRCHQKSGTLRPSSEIHPGTWWPRRRHQLWVPPKAPTPSLEDEKPKTTPGKPPPKPGAAHLDPHEAGGRVAGQRLLGEGVEVLALEAHPGLQADGCHAALPLAPCGQSWLVFWATKSHFTHLGGHLGHCMTKAMLGQFWVNLSHFSPRCDHRAVTRRRRGSKTPLGTSLGKPNPQWPRGPSVAQNNIRCFFWATKSLLVVAHCRVPSVQHFGRATWATSSPLNIFGGCSDLHRTTLCAQSNARLILGD